MSEELPTNLTGLNDYIESLVKKHVVTPVPTDDELSAYIDEYRTIRAVNHESLTIKQINASLERLAELEQHIGCYREHHYGAKQ